MPQNTSRPLMGAAIARKPESIVSATSPNAVFNSNEDPAITGNPQANDPSAPVHDWEKRYKDLQSFHTKTVEQQKSEITTLKATAKPNEFVVPKTAEELAAFSKDNPETFQFIQTIAHDIAAKQVEPIVGRLNSAESALQEEVDSKSLDQLLLKHPDFEAIDASPEFQAWLPLQATHIQSLIYDNPDDASKISTVLDLFKGSTGWGVNAGNTSASSTQQEVNNQAAQAIDTGSTATGDVASAVDPRISNPQYIWSEKEIGLMHPSVYAQYSDAIDLALSEGRVQIGQ